MQTFVPYPDFFHIADVLDYRRLGKQRPEAMQILNAINDPNNGWHNHPVVRMWTGYEEALKLYCNIMIIEWKRRGYNSNMELYDIDLDKLVMPHWLGDEELHRSHQSNLVRKNPEYYGGKFPEVPDNLPYIWPDKSP
jgi:hypothetical protein